MFIYHTITNNGFQIGSDTMKIERINDNQIRCTLTKKDLADRQIKLSELAYGTEKAKALFRDMMQQASFECGFDAEDIPLMIEAIPISSECIILIITKVEDPEELDTRFSKFAPSDEVESDYSTPASNSANDVIDLFNRLRQERTDPISESISAKRTAGSRKKPLKPITLTAIYDFDTLDLAIKASDSIQAIYHGENKLYKDEKEGTFILLLKQSKHTPEEFNIICNRLSEYGTPIRYSDATASYIEEHLKGATLKCSSNPG